MVQCLDDVDGESADVGGRDVGAFGDFEGVERDEVDGVDSASFEGREDVRVRSCGEVREDG